MDVIYQRCCGLDIHKKTVAACLIAPGPKGKVRKQVRTFGTMTTDLLALSDWLASEGVTHGAMESTGISWQPVYNLLEGSFGLLLANAQHLKAVPGRKTDVRDCAWIADRLRHGLLTGSFVPDRPQRELRELTRYRPTLVHERTAAVNRLQKTLAGANIKLASVASDITGVAGRAMLAALVAGTTDATALADLARGKLRAKLPEPERALAGRVGPHQRFLVAEQVAHIDFLDAAIERVSAAIAERVRRFEAAVAGLDTIPGVGRWTAEVLIAERGTDMSRFPTAGHLAAWAGMCPGNRQRAGKRQSGQTRKGSPWLRVALTEAAQAAGRTTDTYLAARFRRLAARLGRQKAAIAVGHAILVIAYHLLKDPDSVDRDLGVHYFDQRDRRALERRLLRRLQGPGYTVTLELADPAA